jgi:hypothetical protein
MQTLNTPLSEPWRMGRIMAPRWEATSNFIGLFLKNISEFSQILRAA